MRTETQDYTPRNFGSYLKRKRIKLKLRKAELARISGVPKSNITRYENGRVPWPRLSNFFALLEVIEK